MSQPIIQCDLVEAAATLLMAQNCNLIGANRQTVPNTMRTETAEYEGEESLMAARVAASAYLVACFDYAAHAADEEAIPE